MRLFGTIAFPRKTAKRPVLYRVLHELELPPGQRQTPKGMPEVRPLFPNHFSGFGMAGQLLSRGMNSMLTDEKWTAIYLFDKWMSNRNGFGDPSDPRANYITGKDLIYNDPKVECLTTGGSIHTGFILSGNFYPEVIDYNAIPSLEWIMERPWFWVYAVSVDNNLTPRRFPQGLQPDGSIVPIIHPFIGDPKRFPAISMPEWRVELWSENFLPDPFVVYKPY